MSYRNTSGKLSNGDVANVVMAVIIIIALVMAFSNALDKGKPVVVENKVLENMTCSKSSQDQSDKQFIQTCVAMCESVGCSKLEVKF